MTSKLYAHDLDLANVAQLTGARIQNVSSTAMAALGEQLGMANKGLFVYNTSDNRMYVWNGAAFDPYQIDVQGDIKFAGIINPANAATVAKTPGFQYVVDAAGTLVSAGYTFYPSAEVEAGDQVLFTSATEAYVIQRNDLQATMTSSGNVRLATAAEASAGTDSSAAITSATLHSYVDPQFAADRARLSDIEAKNVEQDGRLTSVESRATAIEAKNVEQDGRLSSVESRATAIEAKNVEQDARIAATEQKNVEQDGRLTSVESRASAIEAKNVEQDGRLSAVESKNVEQDGRLSAVEAKNVEQDGRISATESKNVEQDSRLASLEGDRVKSFFDSVNLEAGVPFTVSHGLMLANKDGFVIRTAFAGSDISLDVDSVNANSITLTTLVPLNGVTVYITGR